MSVPHHWISTTVGNLFTPVGGGTPNTEMDDYWGGTVPWVSSADIDEHFNLHPRRFVTAKGLANSPTSAVPANSVIVVTRVGLGKIGLVNEEPVCFSQDCQALLSTKGIHPRFIAYQMKWSAMAFVQQSRGTTVAGITKKQLNETPFHVPPAAEQSRIADTLDELFSDLDAGVEALTRVRVKLKLYRASVLKAAVEGTLTAEWRAQHPKIEPAPELLKRILTERRNRWEEEQLRKFKEKGQAPPKNWKAKYKEPVAPHTAELPSLPEGWCWINLDTVIVAGPQNGAYFPGSLYGRGYSILRIDDFQNGWVRPVEELNKVDADDATAAVYYLHEDDIVINRVNSLTHLGKCLVVDLPLVGSLYESNMMRAELAASIKVRYVEIYLHSVVGRTFITQGAKWAVNQASINQQDVKRTPLPLPSREEQEAIIEAVEDQLSVIDHLEADIEAKLINAQALRQAILRHAFTGQLVSQDPNDEPASELLKRIIGEREVRAREAVATRQSKTAKLAHTEERGRGRPAGGRRKKKQQKGN